MSSKFSAHSRHSVNFTKSEKKNLRKLADYLDLINNIDIGLKSDRDSMRTPSPDQESIIIEPDTSDSDKSDSCDVEDRDSYDGEGDSCDGDSEKGEEGDSCDGEGEDSEKGEGGDSEEGEGKLSGNEGDDIEVDTKKFKSIKYVMSHIPRFRDGAIVSKFDAKYNNDDFRERQRSKKKIDSDYNFKSKKIDMNTPHHKQPKLLLKLLNIREESYVVTGNYSCNNKTLLSNCNRFPDSSAYVRMKKRWKREVSKWKIQRKNKRDNTKRNSAKKRQSL